MLGADFPYRQFYPQRARVVQIDRRAEALGNRCALELGLIGDVKETLQSILPRLKNHTDTSHLEDSLADYRAARAGLDRLAEGSGKGPHIHPQYVARLISELASEDAVFTCDVGTQTAWAARYLEAIGLEAARA